MKSKGKKMIGKIETAPYGQAGQKKAAIVLTKTITLQYLESKAVLSLDIPDERLIKMITQMFRRSESELHYFSVLQFLRLPLNKSQERVYTHRIDLKEALSLIFHMKKVRQGEVDDLRQLNELVSIIQNFQIKENEVHDQFAEQFEEKRRNFNNEVYHCRKAIKAIVQERILLTQQNFQTSEEYSQLKVLEIKVKELTLKMFDQTVIGLREINKEQVQIIYEQCYPSRKCSITYLKNKIGEETYLKKKMAFIKLVGKVQREGINNSNLIVCHLCKDLIKRQYVRCCQSNISSVINVHYSNSPITYFRRLIAFDYCYDSYDPPHLDEELDYFKYGQYSKGRRYCNRVYCASCLNNISKLDSYQQITKHKCDVCKKRCVCSSCSLAYELVVGLAYFLDIVKRNSQSMGLFNDLVNYVNFNDSQDNSIKVDYFLRVGFRNTGKEQYIKTYNNCMDRFEKIYKTAQKYRSLAASSYEEINNPSIILTPEMKEIIKFLDQYKYIKKEDKSGKSIAKVMTDFETNNERINHLKETSIKSVKNKFQANPEMHNILRKFCVTAEEPVELTEDLLTEQLKSQIHSNILTVFEPASKNIAENLVFMKSEVPYNEQDYEKMTVSNKYKLITERELHYEHLLSNQIFYDVTNPEYCPLNYQYQTYFEDINNYFAKKQAEEQPIDNKEVKFSEKERKKDLNQNSPILISSSSPQPASLQEENEKIKQQNYQLMAQQISSSNSKQVFQPKIQPLKALEKEIDDEDDIEEINWESFKSFSKK